MKTNEPAASKMGAAFTAADVDEAIADGEADAALWAVGVACEEEPVVMTPYWHVRLSARRVAVREHLAVNKGEPCAPRPSDR
jgi:hypothetical protein